MRAFFPKQLAGLLGLVLLSFNSLAQYKAHWADSVVSAFKTEENTNLKSQISLGDSLLFLFEKENDYCNWIEIAIRKSHYLSAAGRDQDALKAVNDIFNKYQADQCNKAHLLPEIYLAYARIYMNRELSKKAFVYIHKGLNSWNNSFPNKDVLMELYLSKSFLFSNLDSTVYYLNQSYDLALKENDLKHQQGALNDLGYAYAVREMFDEAKSYFIKALKVAQEREAYIQISSIYNNLAGVSTNYQQTAVYLDSAIYYAALKGNLDAMQASRQNAALFHYENGSYKRGYDQLWQSMLLRDSLYNDQKIRAFAEMEQKFQSKLKEQRIHYLNTQNENKTRQRNGLIGGVLLLGVFAVFLFFQRNRIARERKRSDSLLRNILPTEVAEELKSSGRSEAKLYDNVTILFTDFINFTGISAEMSPKELVNEIHHNFTAFDELISDWGVEKIKTIGDAYMAAGGLPIPTEDSVKSTVLVALKMQAFINKRKTEMDNAGKPAFEMRVGIHTGPVVAGIVGVKKFQYDIWGDTVNTASRIESNSEAGKVNISKTTYELLKDDADFAFESRGKIEAKGKGEMEMYFVSVNSSK